MGKKKKYRGHYCKIGNRIKPNEKFTGKRHAQHIYKECWIIKRRKMREKKKSNKQEISQEL